jgi:hypothetical protein
MRRLRRRTVLATVLLAAGGCNLKFPASIPECAPGPGDARVNERGDQDEFTGHPLAAAALANGRALVAFAAQTTDPAGEVLSSEVRIALVDVATGAQYTLCSTSSRDQTLSNPATVAFGASVTPVDLVVLRNHAVALVAWIEGSAMPSQSVQMRFIDGAGCPIGSSFSPYASAAGAVSVAWSEQRKAVLATLHDERQVFRTWVSDVGPAETVAVAAGQGMTYGFPVAAVAGDGSAMVVWADDRGARGLVLDVEGNPRGTDFSVELPLITQTVRVFHSLTVAAGGDRFTVAADQRTLNREVPSRVMAREYDLSGTPLTAAFALDPGAAGVQGCPALAYAPGGTVVAVWYSKADGGAVGRLFGAGGVPRFNLLSCDDGRFTVGTRSDLLLGFPSVLSSGGRVLVFHSAQGGLDPRGSTALLWSHPLHDIWPGPQ